MVDASDDEGKGPDPGALVTSPKEESSNPPESIPPPVGAEPDGELPARREAPATGVDRDLKLLMGVVLSENTEGPDGPVTSPQNNGDSAPPGKKREAIASYQAELAAAVIAAAAPTAQVTKSGVPRLPRLAGVAEFEPHREKMRKGPPRYTLAVVLASFPRKRWNLAPRQGRPWTLNGKTQISQTAPSRKKA